MPPQQIHNVLFLSLKRRFTPPQTHTCKLCKHKDSQNGKPPFLMFEWEGGLMHFGYSTF